MSLESGYRRNGPGSEQNSMNTSRNGTLNYEDLLRKPPTSPGFLVSFLVDARGGTMYGRRHSGVDIVIPPSKVCMPTRLTCRLLKKEKVGNLPQLCEEEAFASRVLEVGPVGTKFIGPVLIELPHFAARIGTERELVILKSNNGKTWEEHLVPTPTEKFDKTNTEHASDKKNFVKIYTSYLPKYFVAITKARQTTKLFDSKGGSIQCLTAVLTVPDGAVNKETKITLEVLPVSEEVVRDSLNGHRELSHIISVKPLRRKFHQPVTVGVSVTKELQEKLKSFKGGSHQPPVVLLYSISGGSSPTVWEDITQSASQSLHKDTVSFVTSVSARYWLLEKKPSSDVLKEAEKLFSEIAAVPFYACFYVLAKKHSDTEVQVRILCMDDGDVKQTLEHEEHFVHLATSEYVEVLNGKSYYLDVTGNMLPSSASPHQLFLIFRSFRVNRLSFMARIQDPSQPLSCHISVHKSSSSPASTADKSLISSFDVNLQNLHLSPTAQSPELEEKWLEAYQKVKDNFASPDNVNKGPELRLLDIADHLKGDWVALAGQLGITSKEVVKLQEEYGNINEQALLMLHLWVDKRRNQAKASELELALKRIGREDIIENCIRKSDRPSSFDGPVQAIDCSFHEGMCGTALNGIQYSEDVQEGAVYEVEDVFDGTQWYKTKKMVPTLVEDPIPSTEAAECSIAVAASAEKEEKNTVVSDEYEEIEEVQDDGTVVKKNILKSELKNVTDEIVKSVIPTLQITKVEDGVEDDGFQGTSVEETEEVLEGGVVVKVKNIKPVHEAE